MTAEAQRMKNPEPWYRWGPYVSERQWGTVREDYSSDGSAWEYFPHDDARSRAYRWGEDGLAGFCDEHQRLCLGLALWNHRDPILKERLFGLTNAEANHGEDVKEIYYYLDALPSHAYLKMLYKYPQQAYPYDQLVAENGRRGFEDPEFELIDTGVFDDDRYFDVFVEYAKADVDDVLMLVTVVNRGPEPAKLVVMPQAWFRNRWSWREGVARPMLRRDGRVVHVEGLKQLTDYRIYADVQAQMLFTENDTNVRRHFHQPGKTTFSKDAFHRYLIQHQTGAVNPAQQGTKAGWAYHMTVPAQGESQVRLRLRQGGMSKPFQNFDQVIAARRSEADAFYEQLQQHLEDEQACCVHRQALAGMVWSKQYYHYNVEQWLDGDEDQPSPPESRRQGRNADWVHLINADVLSMPDKWEYPWYAAWDLGFHCIPLAMLDTTFAKHQLKLLTREWYMHPNGQLPAYEWNFGDVNPPVHAWSAWRVFEIDRARRRKTHPQDVGDLSFLESVFHKLMLNFTWWVNRKDADGRNIFQGGFLGLDNIGVFDRSAPLPTGGHINQSDGTSWVAMYCLNLMRIAIELAQHDAVYEDIATKFLEHFLRIAEAMTNIAGKNIGLWDERDEFYYDVLDLPDGDTQGAGQRAMPIRLRSLVGLIPLFAVETLEPECVNRLPGFSERLKWVLEHKPQLASLVSRWEEPGVGERRLLSLLRGHRMKCLLRRMLDETEFLSDYGVRGVSKYHEKHPYVFQHHGHQYEVRYTPGESVSDLFGGNSNWRGPIWMPVNYLLVESLYRFHHYYGDDFKVECPTGSGHYVTLAEAGAELSRRLCRIFMPGPEGERPVFQGQAKFNHDPHFKDYLLFYEYFHGDTGRGLGASHQTGWTGLVAALLHQREMRQMVEPG